jgi:putative transcriptional regulator
MWILRDIREATKLLILLEIMTHSHSRMKTIAEKMGMTVQGVSDYLRSMREEGLIHRAGGVYEATIKGVEFLHEKFKELREFVERSYRDMRILDICSAVAGEDIREGDRVGLFMERGYLVAYPGRDSSSQGRALYSSKKGEDVAVVELEGIVELAPGRITVLRIPGSRDGGTGVVDMRHARRLLADHPDAKIAVNDIIGWALARKLDLRVDFEFGTVPASIEAAQRGLDVVLLASEDSAADVVSAIEAANEGLEEKIPYEVVALSTKPRGITRGKSKSTTGGG